MTRHFYLQVLPTFFVLVDILVKVKQLLLLNLDTQEGTCCHLLSKILVYYFFYFQDLCDFTNGQLLWMQTRVSCLLMLHYARVFNQNWIVSVTNPKKRLTSSPPQIEVNVQHPTSKMGYKKVFFYKNGPSPASFCLFSFFSNNLQNKNCRLQRDSNSDRQSRRRECWPLDHHHCPWVTRKLPQHNFTL